MGLVELRGPGHGNPRVATAQWTPTAEVETLAWSDPGNHPEKRKENPLYYRRGSLLLGETARDGGHLVGWDDDRHIVTVAGSRAGKGRSCIVPNLKLYPGSVFCIDPKGENARLTAKHRATPREDGGLGQDVYVLDPFQISGVPKRLQATFNPLAELDPAADDFLEEAGAIADSMVVSTDPTNAHWDESARSLIQAVIIHVMTANMRGRSVSLATVREFFRNGDKLACQLRNEQIYEEALANEPGGDTSEPAYLDPLSALLQEMIENDAMDDVVAGQAHKLNFMAHEERGSILSFAERNTRFLDGTPMRTVVQSSLRDLKLASLKDKPNGVSVYLCLPGRYLNSHARWLRLVINALFSKVEQQSQKPATGVPILAILDEFPILGNMKIIETAVGYLAGFSVKLWVILQDINQLRRDYPQSWETFLGNAGVKQFFGNTDTATLEYISKQLGMTEVRREIEDTSKTSTTVATIPSIAKQREINKQEAGRLGSVVQDMIDKQTSDAETATKRIEVVSAALMTPDEIAIHFARERHNQIVLAAGWRPMILTRIDHDDISKSDYQRVMERNS